MERKRRRHAGRGKGSKAAKGKPEKEEIVADRCVNECKPMKS